MLGLAGPAACRLTLPLPGGSIGIGARQFAAGGGGTFRPSRREPLARRKRVRRTQGTAAESPSAWLAEMRRLHSGRADTDAAGSSVPAAASSTESAGCPAPSSPPPRGRQLHLLWATPVLTVDWLAEGRVDDGFNTRLAAAATAGYHGFATRQWRGGQLAAEWSSDRGWLNDAFFEMQKLEWSSRGGVISLTLPSLQCAGACDGLWSISRDVRLTPATLACAGWPVLYGDPDFQGLLGLIERGADLLHAELPGGGGPPLPEPGRTRRCGSPEVEGAPAPSRSQVWAGVHHDGTGVHPNHSIENRRSGSGCCCCCD